MELIRHIAEATRQGSAEVGWGLQPAAAQLPGRGLCKGPVGGRSMGGRGPAPSRGAGSGGGRG